MAKIKITHGKFTISWSFEGESKLINVAGTIIDDKLGIHCTSKQFGLYNITLLKTSLCITEIFGHSLAVRLARKIVLEAPAGFFESDKPKKIQKYKDVISHIIKTFYSEICNA